MGIAISQVQDLEHLLPVGMGIFVACARTVIINRTQIILIKEGTRSILQHVVVVFIDAKVPLDKGRRTDTKYSGESLNVVLIENGTCRLATISAGAAINLFENLFMKAMERSIQVSRVCLLQGIQKPPVLLCPVLGQHMVAL